VAIDWGRAGGEAVEHLRNLIRINTVNPPGNELAAASYIRDVLDSEGIPSEIIVSGPERGNVVARLQGSGKGGRPLLLSAHLDVVAVDSEMWTHDPFGGEIHDGFLWGRGAVDMKNMAAMQLVTMLLLKREGVPLGRDVILAGVADEEAGSEYGSGFLVDKHPEKIQAEYCLTEVGGFSMHVDNATLYPVQVAEKGICWMRLHARGEPGHGSIPHSHQATVKLATAVAKLGTARLPRHRVPLVEEFVRAIAKHSNQPTRAVLPQILNRFLGGPVLDVIQHMNPWQAASLSAMLSNSVAPTIYQGGKKINVIPSHASIDLDGRLIPGQTSDDLVREIRDIIGGDYEIEILKHAPGSVFDHKTLLFDAICRTVRRHDPGAVPIPYMITGFTDAYCYGRLGIKSYGFAPVRLPPGLVFAKLYHGHDERIPVEGFVWGTRLFYELVAEFAGEV